MVKNTYPIVVAVGVLAAITGVIVFGLAQINHVTNSQKEQNSGIQHSRVNNNSEAEVATKPVGDKAAYLSSTQAILQESIPSATSNSDTLMAKLWTAYNQAQESGNVQYANKGIQYANECLNQNQANADKEQTQLQQKGEPLPTKGEPSSDEEFQTIVSREALNNTATCLWLKGNLAKLTGRMDIAKESYKKATKYSYARTLDARGIFSSPSDDSTEKLNKITAN
jgi:hypothetical protein